MTGSAIPNSGYLNTLFEKTRPTNCAYLLSDWLFFPLALDSFFYTALNVGLHEFSSSNTISYGALQSCDSILYDIKKHSPAEFYLFFTWLAYLLSAKLPCSTGHLIWFHEFSPSSMTCCVTPKFRVSRNLKSWPTQRLRLFPGRSFFTTFFFCILPFMLNFNNPHYYMMKSYEDLKINF